MTFHHVQLEARNRLTITNLISIFFYMVRAPTDARALRLRHLGEGLLRAHRELEDIKTKMSGSDLLVYLQELPEFPELPEPTKLPELPDLSELTELLELLELPSSRNSRSP